MAGSKTPKTFNLGQGVWARNYRTSEKWRSGTIVEQLAPLTYLVDVGGQVWKRHVDQLLPRHGESITNTPVLTPIRTPWEVKSEQEKSQISPPTTPIEEGLIASSSSQQTDHGAVQRPDLATSPVRTIQPAPLERPIDSVQPRRSSRVSKAPTRFHDEFGY